MNGFSDVVGRSRAWLARVFISRPFSRVLAGQVVSVTGSNATAVVVPLIAVITLNASSFEVGVLNAAESLAAAVLGIHIGRWCDRIGPDRTMLVSNLTGAVATIGLFAVLHAGVLSFPLLLALLLVVGLAELGFDISRTGYTVSLVPRERLPHANALIEGANAIGEGIGPSVGGWLFDAVGAALSLLFDFVTYVCSSLLVLLNVLERRKRKTVASEHTSRRDGSAPAETDGDGDGDVLSGLRFVWGNGIIRSIAFSAGQFNFFTAAFFTIYYVFVVRVLHMDPVAVGLAATCSGIGGIVSSVAAGALIRRMASGPPVHRHAACARFGGAARAAVGPHDRVRQRRGDRIGMRLPVRVELHRDGEPRPERIHQTGHRPGTAARAGQFGGARHRPGGRAHRRAGGRTVRGHDRRGYRPVPVRGGTGRIPRPGRWANTGSCPSANRTNGSVEPAALSFLRDETRQDWHDRSTRDWMVAG